MSLYLNNKQYTANIIVDKGLKNIDITLSDIRPGKVSIDKDGNKVIAISNEQLLQNKTPGTASASDITIGKTAWVNGKYLTGTATPIANKFDLFKGTKKTYTVASGKTVTSGDFVSIISNTVSKYDGTSNIHGVAIQTGTSGNTIEVIVPN